MSLRGYRASATWSDGTSLTAELHTSESGDWSIAGRVALNLPESRWNSVQGLMGNNDGHVWNDLALRDGTRLPLDPTPIGYDFSSEQLTRELYSGSFRSSWLVQSYESLFTQGVNRFDPFYPSEFISLDLLDSSLIAIAEAACGLEGVTSPAVLSRCVMDVANTGDELFAELAAAADPAEPGISLAPDSIYATTTDPRTVTAHVKGHVDFKDVTWSATGGSLYGSGNTITYYPPAEHSTYELTATLVSDPSISASATIVMGDPLAIAPTEIWLYGGSQAEFAAFGYENQGLQWSASAGDLHPTNRGADYIAPSDGGNAVVQVSLAGNPIVVSTANVHVYGIHLEPSSAFVYVGGEVDLWWINAEHLDIVWEATAGYIEANGASAIYRPPEGTGEYTVTARSLTDPTISATATIYVGICCAN